jgi:hypothetical protein
MVWFAQGHVLITNLELEQMQRNAIMLTNAIVAQ